MEEILDIIEQERKNKYKSINLIASENYVSENILKALGSELTNKYCEGYPGKRFYAGCQNHDKIENITINLAKKIFFNCEYVNVQPHSGTQANMAVYFSLLNPGDKILSLGLDCGGHLSHGFIRSFSGTFYKNCFYKLNKKTECVDLNLVEEITKKEHPDIIICGASSYSQDWDYKCFREIADKYNSILMCDMAHTAGIIAMNKLNNPFNYCHIITSTTQKTLRGPRGGLIFLPKDFQSNKIKKYKSDPDDIKISKYINSSIIPGIQGGPHMNTIAAKGICFNEILSDNFKIYIDNVLKNSKKLCSLFINNGYRVVSNGTVNHLFTVDLTDKNILGIDAEKNLESVGIYVNRETIPFDNKTFQTCFGIRIGVPAITALGFNETDMDDIFYFIDKTLKNINNSKILNDIKNEVIIKMSNLNKNIEIL